MSRAAFRRPIDGKDVERSSAGLLVTRCVSSFI
jgi:hypothetical protein